MKYRIVPYGTRWWRVQRSHFGIFWEQTNAVFDLESQAEDHINEEIRRDVREAVKDAEIKQRKRDIAPRRFP